MKIQTFLNFNGQKKIKKKYQIDSNGFVCIKGI